jgi:hypothetical protein
VGEDWWEVHELVLGDEDMEEMARKTLVGERDSEGGSYGRQARKDCAEGAERCGGWQFDGK